MAKQELGKKRRCASCGMKFYDFNKTNIECPSCRTAFNPDQLLKSRRGRSAKAEPAADAAVAIEETALISDDNAEEETDELGGDEALVTIAPKESDDDESNAILDESVDEDFIDEIEDEADDADNEEGL